MVMAMSANKHLFRALIHTVMNARFSKSNEGSLRVCRPCGRIETMWLHATCCEALDSTDVELKPHKAHTP